MTCPECGSRMELKNSKYGPFYGCTTFPKCRATHGAHPDGKPLGTPADKETKQLRIKIHRLCDGIWGEWESKECDRKGMYAWLKKNAPKPHIAEMDKEELLKAERLLMELMKACL